MIMVVNQIGKNNNTSSYDKFQRGIEQATNEINQRNSIKTMRTGLGGIRDKIAFLKVAITFAYAYVAIIQSLVIFLGITPQAIENINGFMLTLGIRYQFPVNISSIVAVSIIIGLFVFGVLSMLFLGLYKREQEVTSMQQPGYLYLSKQNDEILDRLKKIEGEIGK